MVMSEITAISEWFSEVLQGCELAVTLVMFSLLHCYDWCKCSGTLQTCHAMTFFFLFAVRICFVVVTNFSNAVLYIVFMNCYFCFVA